MQKKTKRLLLIIGGVVVGYLLFVVVNLFKPCVNNAERFLNRYEQQLVLTIDLIEESDYSNLVSINKRDFSYKNSLDEYRFKKCDEEFVTNIKKLIPWKVKGISKDNEYVKFRCWNSIFHFNAGLVYAPGNEENIAIECMTKLEPLSKEGWYYYEVDYNKWREEHYDN